jgi:adenosine deaminase
MSIDLEALQAFPKVSLHDHLDGALRPQTIIELAADIGHPLPADNADDLGRWFARAADSGSLVRYLETFDQTLAVMQTVANLRRVAAEYVRISPPTESSTPRRAGPRTTSAGGLDQGRGDRGRSRGLG